MTMNPKLYKTKVNLTVQADDAKAAQWRADQIVAELYDLMVTVNNPAPDMQTQLEAIHEHALYIADCLNDCDFSRFEAEADNEMQMEAIHA